MKRRIIKRRIKSFNVKKEGETEETGKGLVLLKKRTGALGE